MTTSKCARCMCFEHFGAARKFTHGNHGTLTLKACTKPSGVFPSAANAASRASGKEEPTASKEDIQPTTSFRRNLSASATVSPGEAASPSVAEATPAEPLGPVASAPGLPPPPSPRGLAMAPGSWPRPPTSLPGRSAGTTASTCRPSASSGLSRPP